jgi:hypothetical protein
MKLCQKSPQDVRKKTQNKKPENRKTEKLWTGFPERKNVKGGREGCVESSSFKTFFGEKERCKRMKDNYKRDKDTKKERHTKNGRQSQTI